MSQSSILFSINSIFYDACMYLFVGFEHTSDLFLDSQVKTTVNIRMLTSGENIMHNCVM